MHITDTTIEGVSIHHLDTHSDERGGFTEIYRENWLSDFKSIQWNIVTSVPNTLRGVHVHKKHFDYLMVVSGQMLLGLHDLRPTSTTSRRSELLELSSDQLRAVSIPPGVCHGFFFPVSTTHLYSVSDYFNPADELGCRFDCPELNLSWPNPKPILSERDRTAESYAEMMQKLNA